MGERVLPKETFDVRVLLQRALHDLHPLAGRVGVGSKRPSIRQCAGAASALAHERSRLLWTEERRGRCAACLESLKILTPHHAVAARPREQPCCANEADVGQLERLDEPVIEGCKRPVHLVIDHGVLDRCWWQRIGKRCRRDSLRGHHCLCRRELSRCCWRRKLLGQPTVGAALPALQPAR